MDSDTSMDSTPPEHEENEWPATMTNIYTAYDNYAAATTAAREAVHAARISAHTARNAAYDAARDAFEAADDAANDAYYAAIAAANAAHEAAYEARMVAYDAAYEAAYNVYMAARIPNDASDIAAAYADNYAAARALAASDAEGKM